MGNLKMPVLSSGFRSIFALKILATAFNFFTLHSEGTLRRAMVKSTVRHCDRFMVTSSGRCTDADRDAEMPAKCPLPPPFIRSRDYATLCSVILSPSAGIGQCQQCDHSVANSEAQVPCTRQCLLLPSANEPINHHLGSVTPRCLVSDFPEFPDCPVPGQWRQ